MSKSYYCGRCLTTFPDDQERCSNLGCQAARPSAGWGTLLGAGDVLDRHYYIVRALAGGGAGMTYLAREIASTNELLDADLAIKVLYAQRDRGPFVRRLANEAQILQELAHDNIVRYLGFVHRSGRAPYLLTAYEKGGNLASHVHRVGRLEPRVAAAVLVQVMSALEVAHEAGVVHRDLKPHNVLLTEAVQRDAVPHVRVADFGIAKVGSGLPGVTSVGAFVGTPEYAAPEQFAGAVPQAATDVFAAGAMLCFLVNGAPPERFAHRLDIAASYAELLDQIPPRLEGAAGVAPAHWAAIQRVVDHTMRAVPEERWTVAEARGALHELAQDGPALPFGNVDHTPDLDPRMPGPGGTIVGEGSATFILEEAVERAPDPAPARMRAHHATPPPSRPRETTTEAAGPTPRPPVRERSAPPDVSLPEPAARELTLEDLLDFTTSEARPPGPRERAPRTAALAFDHRDFTELDAAFVDADASLPSEPQALLSLLGTATASTLPALASAIGTVDPDALGKSIRDHHRASDVALRRGVALAIAVTERPDFVSVARSLLRDPDGTVRAAAAEALGSLATGSSLVPLARLLADPDPQVRVTAALAVARACRATGDVDRARAWLAPLCRDPDPAVREAWEDAMEILR